MRFHSSCLFDTGQSLLVEFGLCASIRLVFFDTGQSLLVDFCLCAPTRLVFFTLVSRCWWTLTCALPLVLSFSHWSMCASIRLVFFDTGQSLLEDFCLCAPTRLVFFTLVSRCWWTLTCALPLVLSFSHWSMCASIRLVFFDTGQSLLVDFCLCAPTRLVFFTLVNRCWWTLTCALPLVLSFSHWSMCASIRLLFFDTGQSLLVDFCLCAPTRLVFFTLVSRCWWTLTCALPLVLSFSHWSMCASIRLVFFDTGQSLLVDFCLCAPTRLVFFTLVSRCWWTLTCALPLVLSFSHWSMCASIRLVFIDTGQSLLVDFCLCAPTRLVFFTLVNRCWWTLTCALPLVLSFSHWSMCASIRLVFFDTGQSLLVDFCLCAPTRLVFLTLVSRCWWTFACALPLVLSFSHWSAAVGGL